MAQACHASVAALFKNKDDANVNQYLGDIETMHKVVMEISSEQKLRNLAKRLEDANVDHHLWIEQPEGVPTALATKPYERDFIKPFFKKLKLYK